MARRQSLAVLVKSQADEKAGVLCIRSRRPIDSVLSKNRLDLPSPQDCRLEAGLTEHRFKLELSLLPVRHHAGKKVSPSLAVIAIKGVSEFVANHIIDQVRTGPYEINIQRNIAVQSVETRPLAPF
jgi:hypothetical protein